MSPEDEVFESQSEQSKEKITAYPTPEELASLKARRPEQFAFTKEWCLLVQARAAYDTFTDTGLLH